MNRPLSVTAMALAALYVASAVNAARQSGTISTRIVRTVSVVSVLHKDQSRLLPVPRRRPP